MIKRNHKAYALALGIAAVFMFYLTWCFATISYQGSLFLILHTLGTVVTIGLCIAAVHIYQKYTADSPQDQENSTQIGLLSLLLVLVFGLALIWDIRYGANKAWFIISDVAWCAAGVYLCRKLRFDLSEALRKVADTVKRNWQLLILLAVCLVLAIEPGKLQFKWDGALYEQACRAMNIHSLSSLGAYGHLGQGYGVLYCLINALIGSSEIAMAVLNILMYLVSVAAFYGIVKWIKSDLSAITACLLTAVYAFSPFVLGMVNYYSLDYAMLCLGVVMLYFAFRKKWVLHFAAALLFCFTKEPAILAYGFLCIGFVVTNWFADCPKGTGFGIRLSKMLGHREHYLMLTTGVLWFVTYLQIGGWSGGNGAFALDMEYVGEKLKVLYLLNFSWILTALAIVGAMTAFIKTERNLIKHFIVLALSALGFTLISVAFATVNHARYAGVAPVILSVMAVIALLILFRKKAVQIVAALLAVLMLISSYVTIDPVSRVLFEQMDTGSGSMITTGSPAPGDSMIYNKQMLGMENALSEAIGYAIENNYQIFLPTYNDNSYAFDGMMISGEKADDFRLIRQYWNQRTKLRTAYESKDTIVFETYQLLNETDLTALKKQDQYAGMCYIYADILGKEQAETIKENHEVTAEKEFTYRGWKIYLVVF